jgi:hypothetical protein
MSCPQAEPESPLPPPCTRSNVQISRLTTTIYTHSLIDWKSVRILYPIAPLLLNLCFLQSSLRESLVSLCTILSCESVPLTPSWSQIRIIFVQCAIIVISHGLAFFYGIKEPGIFNVMPFIILYDFLNCHAVRFFKKQSRIILKLIFVIFRGGSVILNDARIFDIFSKYFKSS